ncbi:hypothetical protein ARMGADRAFT_1033828 [Armillaria gallica]|uniref:Uncharacterized protein n=1 Tax=Armillaria gallica TaxID=47427 RepID=A0A2H3D503_ARMGA|nr:hypothetical protein ARMGADRAFT_1033828 [Armillaria gallica]
MLAPEIEHVPDDETYPGGSLMICYKDTNGYLHNEIFSPNDWVAFGTKCVSTVIKHLYGDVVADSVDYKSLVEGNGGPIAFFSPTLWIRVWDPGFPIFPGDTRDLFGVDMVDVCGHPQAVNTCVKVIAGVRPAIALEWQGDIIVALDDIRSGSCAGHERIPVWVGLDQLIKGAHDVLIFMPLMEKKQPEDERSDKEPV